MKRVLFAVLALSACHPQEKAMGASPSSKPVPAVAVQKAEAPKAEEPTAEEPPKEPPYDLTADLEARKKALVEELGKKTKFETVESVFLITAPNGGLGSSAVVTKKALEAYFNNRFAKRPDKAVTVLLFENAPPYEAFCKAHWGKPCMTPFGFYTHDIRTVVMNVGPGIGTLTHELVHPIVEADFPSAPDWINEGIASLYEAFALPKPGDIRGNKNFRWPRLVEAINSKTERTFASVPALFAMSDKVFRGKHEGLNYATARYFCMWMDHQKKLWPFYQAWRDDFANDPTGEKAFAKVMGKKPSEIDDAWASWVKAL